MILYNCWHGPKTLDERTKATGNFRDLNWEIKYKSNEPLDDAYGEEGKKLKFSDGWNIIWTILRIRFQNKLN